MAWNPVARGTSQSDGVDYAGFAARDIALMKEAGFNAVRTYGLALVIAITGMAVLATACQLCALCKELADPDAALHASTASRRRMSAHAARPGPGTVAYRVALLLT